MNNEVFNRNLFKMVDNSKPNEYKNVVISGVSIKMALAMLLNGAEGQSKEELESFLGKNEQDLNKETLNILSECGACIKLANSFWVSKPNQIKDKYKELIKKYQSAESSVEDFNSQDTVNKINSWVSDNTNGLINKMIDELSSQITSLLINTLYFKGQWWPDPFYDFLTKDKEFFGTERTSIVKMMNKNTNRYFENEKAKGVSLYYNECNYEFIAVLPNKEGEFKIEDLDLNSFEQKQEPYKVSLFFPRLDINYEIELNDELKSIGLRAPFVNTDDFNSMLSISQNVDKVIHKVVFKLDEKGTEAVAATEVKMARSAQANMGIPKEIELVFDRPFAFMIRHMESKELLFVGKINNL